MQRRQSARVRLRLHQAQATSNQGQGEYIPAEGDWPVDPQQDVEVSEKRIWVDGCFDFAHHGMPAMVFPNMHILITVPQAMRAPCCRPASWATSCW
jgi:hypothetical protein